MGAFRIFILLCSACSCILLVTGCSTPPAKSETALPQTTKSQSGKIIKPATSKIKQPATFESAIAATTHAAPAPAPEAQPPATRIETPSAPTKQVSTTTAPLPEKPVSSVAHPVTHTTPPTPTPTPKTSTKTQKAPEAAVIQPAPVITPPPPEPEPELINVSLEKLPVTLHEQWILDRSETQCILKSITLHMDDGQGGTRITLQIMPGSLSINTESDIDLSYTGTGIDIDETHFTLETVAHRTNLNFSKQRQAILTRMQNGRDMRLTLGFWPSWPITRTYSANISLIHFASAMQAWETCNQLLRRQ